MIKNYTKLSFTENFVIFIITDLKYNLRFIVYNYIYIYLHILLSDNLIIGFLQNNMLLFSYKNNYYSLSNTFKKLSSNLNFTCIHPHKIELILNIVGCKFEKKGNFLVLYKSNFYKIYIKIHSIIFYKIGSKGTSFNASSYNSIYLNKVVFLLKSICPVSKFTGKGIKYINEIVAFKSKKTRNTRSV